MKLGRRPIRGPVGASKAGVVAAMGVAGLAFLALGAVLIIDIAAKRRGERGVF